MTTATTTATTLLRVEKGHAEPEELAAITAVLLARAAAGRAAGPAGPAGSADPGRATAGWRRLERRSAFESPRAWHSGSR